MKTRVITAFVGLFLLLLVFFIYPTYFFNVILIAVTGIAVHEVYDAFQLKAPWVFAALFAVVIFVMLELKNVAPITLWAVFYALVLLFVSFVLVKIHTLSFAKLCGTAIFTAIIVGCFYSFLHLRAFFPNALDSVYVSLLILSFAWGGDTSAYFIGCAFGKHKLAPQVSPHKTIEGALGGIAGSILVAFIVHFIYSGLFGTSILVETYGMMWYLILTGLAIVGAILGILGDLFASAVKRQCEIKDYGTIFPGHGGILDRFDSVLLIAPFMTFVIRILVHS